MKIIVTEDIVETLTRRYGLQLVNGIEERIRKLEHEFLKSLEIHFQPECTEYIIVPNEEIDNAYNAALENEKLPIISIDDLFERAGIHYFQINRMYNPQSRSTYFTPRSGYKSLKNQIRVIKKRLNCNEVVVVDRGLITGRTLACTVELFRRNFIDVKTLYTTIYTPDGLVSLKEKIGNTTNIRVLLPYGNCDEWIEARDLVGISGRICSGYTWIPYFVQQSCIKADIQDKGGFKEKCVSFLRELEMLAGFRLEKTYRFNQQNL